MTGPGNPRALWLACTIALAAGCGTYRVNRAALVPHAVPSLHSGQPIDGLAEMSFGLSSVAHSSKPHVGDPSAAVEIPGTQVHADGRLALGDVLSLGLVYENGLDETAYRPKGNAQPPVDEGNVQGFGAVADVSVPTPDPRLHVGLSFDVMVWHVPYVEYRVCVESCLPGEEFVDVERGFDDTEAFGFAVTPSYDTGSLTVFGGLTARQHPTIIQKGIEQDPLLDSEAEVSSGAFNLILSAGIEAGLAGDAVKLSAIVYQDFTPDPVEYGPGLAALVSVPLGRRRAPPPPAQPVYPPPPHPSPAAPPSPPPP